MSRIRYRRRKLKSKRVTPRQVYKPYNTVDLTEDLLNQEYVGTSDDDSDDFIP